MAGLRLDLGRVDKDLISNDSDSEQNLGVEPHEMDPLGDSYSPDDQLNPLEKLEKYFQSEEAIEREIAVRSMVEAAHYVSGYPDFEIILEIVCAMASDHEPMIRIGVLGTVMNLIERNSQFRDAPNIETTFSQENEDRIYEIPVKMLNDFNQQVRRISHNTIVMLLEDPRSSTNSLVSQLCPMVRKCLGKEETYDLRMDTVMLIGRVASFLGQEVCVSEFVPQLPALASDAMFHVRKSFAICCKDLCSVIGPTSTEEVILPYFIQLCKDEVWGVRKACADVFMDVSLGCSLLSRQERLTPVFLHLLKDDSRWVRKAAYQYLGPFISTFYSPPNELSVTDTSIQPLSESELLENSLIGVGGTSTKIVTSTTSSDSQTVTSVVSEVTTPTKGAEPHILSPLMIFHTPPKSNPSLSSPTETNEFNTFLFWRPPIKTLPPLQGEASNGGTRIKDVGTGQMDNDALSVDLFGGGVAGGDEITRRVEGEELDDDDDDSYGLNDIKDELLAESEGGVASGDGGVANEFTSKLKLIESPIGSVPNGFPTVRVFIQSASGQIHEEQTMSGGSGGGAYGCHSNSTPFNRMDVTSQSTAMDMTTVFDGNTTINNEPYFTAGLEQEIVPDELIEMYLGMVDLNKTQSVDVDLPLYCAFSFPAVLQTLGPNHWSLLKPTFDILSTDMQWKIRRVLAHSIHEIAHMLGSNRTVSDLLSVVNEYATKDLDDVKTGVLAHLAEFFEMLPSDVRKENFPSILNGILDTENEKNWRYRDSLAEQLMLLSELFDCSFVEQFIVPVAIRLGHDKVAQIRDSASRLIGSLLHKFSQSSPTTCSLILTQLRTSFATSERWLLRLMYVKQCELFFHKRLISYSLFGSECLPSLLTLSNDVVPNVRLAVARTLYSTLDNTQFISANQSFSQDISSIVSKLKEDKDRDVRYYSGNHEDINNNTETSLSPSTPSNQQLQQFENTQEEKLDIANAGSILQLT